MYDITITDTPAVTLLNVDGLPGPLGFSGYSGYSGAGSSGASGYSGYSGANPGASGYSGYSGHDGTIGVDGASGYSGYSGANPGASGYSGYSGQDAAGASGYSGYSGDNPGSSGYSGYSGSSGYSGYSGRSGADGSSGISGYSGYSGYSGFGLSGYSGSGVSGYSGKSGYSGYSGKSGYSGAGMSGFSGYSGAGLSGFSGYSGANPGASGYSGYSGAFGISGWSGYSGYSGINGVLGGPGVSGYSGYSGSGISGYSGYSGAGLSGYSGYSGNSTSGYSGYSGPSGYSGYSGSIGSTGPSGYSGYSGNSTSGYSGYSGAPGSVSFSGYSGQSGYSGYSGYSGKSGYSGYSGSGVSGYSGYSGAGLSGYSGYSGSVGATGSTGGAGISGYSGYSGGAFPVTSVTAFGTTASRGIASEVWIAVRSDNKPGSGTAEDPFDGSTTTKFDTLLNGFGDGMNIHVGPGVFTTKGDIAWRPKNNWQVRLTSETTIRLDVLTSGDVAASGGNSNNAILSTSGTTTLGSKTLIQDLVVDGGIWDLNMQNQTQAVTAQAITPFVDGLVIRNAKFINWGTTFAGEAFIVGAASDGNTFPRIHNRGVLYENLEFTQPAAITNAQSITLMNVNGGGNVQNPSALSNGWFEGVTVRNCFFHDITVVTSFALDCINLGGYVKGFHGHGNRFVNIGYVGQNGRYAYYLDTGSLIDVKLNDDQFINSTQAVTLFAQGTGVVMQNVSITNSMMRDLAYASITLSATTGASATNNTVADNLMICPAATYGVSIINNQGTRLRNNLINTLAGSEISLSAGSTAAERFNNRTLSGSKLDPLANVIVLSGPDNVDGAGAILQSSDPTSPYFGTAKFNNAATPAANYMEFRLIVPENLDTTVPLQARLKFVLSSNDSAHQRYVISMADVGSGGAFVGSLINPINFDYLGAGGTTGAVLQVGLTVLTGWAAALTPGDIWVIRVARAGNDAVDTSTIDSYAGPLEILYGTT